MLVYMDDSLIQEDEAKVSIFDRGFMYGDGLFETMRSYKGVIFRVEKHLRRLFHSAKLLRLEIPKDEGSLKNAIYQTIKANDLLDAYIKLTITRGVGKERRVTPTFLEKPRILIFAAEFKSYPERVYREGFSGTIVNVRQNEFSPISNIKSLNFLNNLLAKMEAESLDCDEGIMLNTKGNVCEGAVSNIFIVNKGCLLTPSLSCGVLPGITRAAVMELAPEIGVKIVEREVFVEELIDADECFLTNSLIEVMPLTSIDGKKIGDGKPGKITLKFHAAYRNLVEREVKAHKL